MRIGFISQAFPEKPEAAISGIYRRMGLFIQAIKQMGEMDMLFYVDANKTIHKSYIADMEHRLQQHWGARLALDLCNLAPPKQVAGRWEEYITPALHTTRLPPYEQSAQAGQVAAVDRLLSRKPDILFVHRLSAMMPVLLVRRPLPPVYFDMDDIEHMVFVRSIKQPPLWPTKRLYFLRVPALRLLERRAIRLSRKTFVCSEQDRLHLEKAYGLRNVSVIPNAVDIPEKPEVSSRQTLLFLGIFTYPPNAAAADFLIKSIWPRVLAALPDAKLLIAGAHPDRIPSFQDRPGGVEFLGFVDDLDALYRETMAVCCPILLGGGTRIKILEAAAYGKAIVSTRIGAEGIELKDGEEVLLQDDPANFAEACIRLLSNRTEAMRIGQAARDAIIRNYRSSDVEKKIRNYLTSLN